MHNRNIAILNTSDIGGGAARAAYGLYQSLRDLKVPVKYLVKQKLSNDSDILQLPYILKVREKAISSLLDKIIKENRTSVSNTLFKIDDSGDRFFPYADLNEYEVIHLHWITNFLNPEIIYNLGKSKNLVWTLHDTSSFTAGCHYTSNCNQFHVDCSNCPQLESLNGKQIQKVYFERKLKFLSAIPITFVVASKWMESLLKESRLFSKHRIEYIPYSINTSEVFKPLDKMESKRRLGIPNKSISILFAADNGNEKRKGFQLLLDALLHLSSQNEIKNLIELDQIQLVCLGQIHQSITKLGFPWISIPRIESDELLNIFYNSGDMLILPSIEDNLPLTMLESISAGTPIVAFAVGGMKDIVNNDVNGEIVNSLSAQDLSEAMIRLIRKVLADPLNTLSKSTRQYAEANLRRPKEALAYIDLYSDLNKKTKSSVQGDLKGVDNPYIKMYPFTYMLILLKLFKQDFISTLPHIVYKKFVPEFMKIPYRLLKKYFLQFVISKIKS